MPCAGWVPAPGGRAYLAAVLTLPKALGGVSAEDLAGAWGRRSGWAWAGLRGCRVHFLPGGGAVTVGEVAGVILWGCVLGKQSLGHGSPWAQQGEGPRPGGPGLELGPG